MQNRFLNFLTILGVTKWGKFSIFCEEILYLLIPGTTGGHERGIRSDQDPLDLVGTMDASPPMKPER